MKFKNLLILSTLTLPFLLVSCGKDNKHETLEILKDPQYGAVLREKAVDATNRTFNINDLSSEFNITLEAQDEKNGSLLKNIEVYLNFVDRTQSNGTVSKDEVFFKQIQPSDSSFSLSDNNLPLLNHTFSLSDALAALELEKANVSGEDIIQVRYVYNLTDDRSFTDKDVTRSLQGSYFNSRYLYIAPIKCVATDDIPVPGTYTFTMSDSYGDGWNGAYLSVILNGSESKVGIPSWEDLELTSELLYNGDYSSAEYSFIVPEGSTEFKVIYVDGEYDSEVSYSITYTDANGNTQLPIDEVSPSPGEKTPFDLCK